MKPSLSPPVIGSVSPASPILAAEIVLRTIAQLRDQIAVVKNARALRRSVCLQAELLDQRPSNGQRGGNTTVGSRKMTVALTSRAARRLAVIANLVSVPALNLVLPWSHSANRVPA